jgi:hypothetical protein
MFTSSLRCLAIVLLTSCIGLGQNNNSSTETEVQTLKERVAELEQQNRAILDALHAIQSKIGVTTEAAPVVSATMDTAAPAAQTAPASSAAQQAVRWGDLDLGGANKFKFYGFLRWTWTSTASGPTRRSRPFISPRPIQD